MSLAGHVAGMVGRKGAYSVLMVSPEEKR